MDGDPVIEGERGVMAGQVRSGGVVLELRDEVAEGVVQAAQEREDLVARQERLHHHEAHQVQPEVLADCTWIDGRLDPAEVFGSPLGGRAQEVARASGRVGLGGAARAYEAALLKSAQGGI